MNLIKIKYIDYFEYFTDVSWQVAMDGDSELIVEMDLKARSK